MLLKTLKYILQHPYNQRHRTRALFRFFAWQVRSRLLRSKMEYAFTDKAKLLIGRGMTGATGNLYCGLHEFHDMGFALHVLRPGDTFFDIGANVGSYTILASAHVGAMTLAVEPVPSTFACLRQNIEINHVDGLVSACNVAVGDRSGTASFTRNLDTTNHMAKSEDADTILVSVKTVNELADGLECPVFIKIDVEGFETAVIRGASKVLQDNQCKALLIELGGAGEAYGYSEWELHQQLLQYGFRPFQYDAISRKLQAMEESRTTASLYIRDLQFVQDRIQSAARVKLPLMQL